MSQDVQDCSFLWRGTSTDLLVIGPFGAVPEGHPPDDYGSFDTVALRTIEVPVA